VTLKQFSTAGKQRAAASDGKGMVLPDVPFEIDGQKYVARAPKDSQLALLVAATVESKGDRERVGAVLDFFEQVLAQPGRGILHKRMLDPDDSLDLGVVLEVFDHVIGEWGGSPSTSANA
jgi:hypothetical protein